MSLGCEGYNELNRATRKADFFDKKNVYNCDYKWNYYTSLDWKGPGWYRVVDPAGSMLAESVEGIDEYHCGTQGAAWLRQGTKRKSAERGMAATNIYKSIRNTSL